MAREGSSGIRVWVLGVNVETEIWGLMAED